VIVETTGNNSGHASTTAKYVFPATFAQQRLWFLEQLQPGSASYLIPWSLRIQGQLNAEALQRSLNEIVRRHEILRTSFSWKDGAPVQVVTSELSLAMPVRDLSSSPNREQEVQKLALEEARKPLDLERGPLVRAQLLRLGAEDHILLLTMHHIMFDGWSRRILVRELAALYEAFGAGKPSPLPEPKLQYADYAVWQRKQFQGVKLEKELSYWRQQLAGAPASLDLPTDRPRPAMQTFSGAKTPFSFSKEFNEKLQTFSRERGVTAFMTLLAGFQILLSRYSNQDDVVVGTPVANRNRAEIEEMIGFFTNTLVLRTRLSGEATFAEVLAQVKETALGAYAHQDVPFEKLVGELQPERNLGQNPLFQVMFSYQNAPRRAFELGTLKVSLMDVGEATSKFDLSVFLSETPEGVGGRVEYNTDLFDAVTIERMTGHYCVLLEAALASPELPASQLPLLTQSEANQILMEWNATQTDFSHDLCLHQWIEQQAQRSPDAVAVVMGGEQISYRALDERSSQLAHYLRARGVGTETLVGVYLERSINIVVALLGVLKAGAAYIPLDPAYPAERIGFILEDAGAAVLLTQRDLLSALPSGKATPIDLDEAQKQIAQKEKTAPSANVRGENLAYVLYTSGSTGKPKGVQITHSNLVNFLLSMQREPGLKPGDRLLAVTTISFDIAGLELYLPLVSGAQIVLASRAEAADGQRLMDLMQKRKPTVIQATPATWRMLIEAGWQGTSGLKVLCGGEALPGDLAAQLLPRCAELWNMYGPTETTIWSSVHLVKSATATAPIGRPIANTTFYILGSGLQPVPRGVAGELLIGGAGVARGYLGRSELTAEKFISDPFSQPAVFGQGQEKLYRTGDLARYLPDGNVQYLGRTDFQVKIRGFRIELGEIETVLAKHPAVQQVVVAAREDSPGNKRLVAYIVTKPGQHLNLTEARAHLKANLPDYMLPTAVVQLEALPLTPNGKVDRKALPKPDFESATPSGAIQPRDEVETKLQTIWQEILLCGPMGVTDNFFDLGGHSLMAVRLVTEIQKAMGIEIPLTELFQGATIEHLANLVRGTTTVKRATVNQIQAGGDRPPFFAAVLAGINALGYVPLAKHLGPEQPFYTLQKPGPGPQAVGRPYTRAEYEDVAGEYVRAMREKQPVGPYYVGGTCEGARIAFEMTRILESQGQKVGLLAVIDTWVLENTQHPTLWKIYYYSDRLRRWWRQPLRAKTAMARNLARKRTQRLLDPKSAQRKSEWVDAYWPGDDFVPARVRARVTVYKVPKQPFYYHADPLLGWGSRTISGVDTCIIPEGRHLLLLREPHVRKLAAALAKTLNRLQAPRQKPRKTEEPAGPAEVAAAGR